MRLVNYSFKKQLKIIFERLCYLALGQKIDTNIIQSRNLLFYQIPIAEKLHDHYYQEQFKFAPQNITKKTIAEDIQVHLTKNGDLSWEIDEFGSFKVQPTNQYLERVLGNLERQFEFAPCDEYSQKIPKLETHIFDYIIDDKLCQDTANLLYELESRARVVESLNHHNVIRNMWFQEQEAQNLNSLQSYLFGSKSAKKYPIHLLRDKNRQISNKKKNEYKHSACFPQNKVFYEKMLPQHSITPIKHWAVSKQQKMLDSLEDMPLSMLIVKYGDYVDEYSFEKCEQVLEHMIERHPKQGKKLQASYDKIRNYNQ